MIQLIEYGPREEQDLGHVQKYQCDLYVDVYMFMNRILFNHEE